MPSADAGRAHDLGMAASKSLLGSEELSMERLVVERPNNFDAIRIAMALLVVWSHSFALYYGTEAFEPLSLLTAGAINAGNLGVDVFFIVSGYLITQSFERCRSPWSFLRKRIARIYPGFLVATGLCAFVLLPWYAGTHYTAATIGRTLGLNLLLQGWFVTPEPFLDNPVHAVNGALWSIPFEFWCYLGVLTVGMAGLLKRRVFAVAALAAVIGLHVWLDETGRKPGGGVLGVIIGWPYLWSRMAPLFTAGMVTYLYREAIPRSGWIALGTLLALILSAHYSALAVDVLSPIAVAYGTFYVAFSPRTLQAARYGDFSYGTYLYAFPIQQLLVAETRLAFPVFVAAALLLSVLAGTASWYGVERWFHRSGRARHGNLIAAEGSAAAKVPA